MAAAAQLSLLHASTMERLSSGRELWLHRVRANYRGEEVDAWTREPHGTFHSLPLVQAARDGHNALDRAVQELARAARIDPPLGEGWPPDRTMEGAQVGCEPIPGRSPQRASLDIGR